MMQRGIIDAARFKPVLTLLLAVMPLLLSAKVSLTAITVEGRDGTVEGLDVALPRFGWAITSDEQDVVQTAYRVVVASTESGAQKGNGDCWDSGIVKSDQSQWVEYDGKTLLPDRTYYVRVTVTTNRGKATLMSRWSTGLLGDGAWRAQWIGTDSLQPGDVMDKHSRCPARYFRKEFLTRGKVVRAVAHVAGLGYFTLYVNGLRVGRDVMAPPQTDFTKTVAYCSYDVTDMLADRNAIGVAVGAGYFFAPRQKYQTNVRTSYGLPRLRLQLTIDYADGTRETVVTGRTWRMTVNGPIRYSNIYDGEGYDARLSLSPAPSPKARGEYAAWAAAGYDDASWLTPDTVKAPGGRMRGNITPPMRVYEAGKPVAVKHCDDRWVVDFGTNGAGVPRLYIDAARGDTVRLRFAELLQKDGVHLYTDNLRQAQAADYYVSDGTPRWWHPEFTWHGFRYMEVSGVRSLDPSRVERLLIADEMATGGDSISIIGDSILNRVIANARRGIRSNYKSFPIDCPQRDERMPWDGDRTTGCLGESYLMDNYALYAKWMDDFGDSQLKNGALSDVTPAYWRLYNGNVTWPAALPFGCDMLYRQYGDLLPFRKHWTTIARWMDYVKAKSYKNGLVTYDRYGDWCVPPEGPKVVVSKDSTRNTDGTLISSAYYFYLCRMMARYAALTGHDADSAKYADEAALTRDAINKAFLGATGYANNTVTANLLPLAMGIVPEDKEAVVLDRLIATIHANGDHLSSGVIGIQWLLRYLADNGYGWLAYKIAAQDTYPGWGYMAKNGATTIWELWNGNTANPSMNSGNHVMLLGDLLPFCFENLAGIRPGGSTKGSHSLSLPKWEGESTPVSPADGAGFKHIVLQPDFGVAKLRGVYASHRSPYGLISSRWERKDGKIVWTVCIPANTTAELHLPDTVLTVGSGQRTVVYDAAMQRRTQPAAGPTMGWSSWNTYRVNINDSLIERQADALVATGLSDLGYRYVNIDDGYFGGRDSITGRLLIHPTRFPRGLKSVVDHIHGLGLKAGIYSDGGCNTCGSYYDNDSIGVGVGLYGHDHQDAQLFFRELGFDFIKVDFCGGSGGKGRLLLDECERYTAIARAIRRTGRGDVRMNACRWDYPGTWVHDVAFSWRTTADISPRWDKVKNIIAQNLYLKAYAYGGRYNDMDMLEVGRSLKAEEDKTHFGLWCFMNSPLLIGCDLTRIKPAALELLKNRRLIAINQDPLHDQPSVVEQQEGCFILARDLGEAHGLERAFAVYNPTDEAKTVSVDLGRLLLGGNVTLTDAFTGDSQLIKDNAELTMALAPHATAIYTARCTKRLPQTRYEAEAAYISDYQELRNNQAVGTGIYEYDDACSGGLKATWLGGSADNDLVFDDVYVAKSGLYTITIATAGRNGAMPRVEVNGKDYAVSADGAVTGVSLDRGSNRVRLYNSQERMADIDYIEISK